jgi:thioredoxin reductase (NADPH)
MYFANHACTVTLVVRGDSLAASMSHYLIEQLSGKSNVNVQLRSEAVAAHGDTHLTAIDIRDGASGRVRREDCGGPFVFIGADADTGWLPADIARDARGLRGRRGQHDHRFRQQVPAGGRAVAFRAKGAR